MRDQVVVVTGAASGIGRSVAKLCAERGAVVALMDRDEAGLSAVSAELAVAGGSSRMYGCDVSDVDAVDAVFERIRADIGVPRGLFTAAGVDLGGLAHELPRDRWRRVLDVNLNGSFFAVQAVLRTLVAENMTGSIVLCSSPAASVGFAAGGNSAYAASKGAISALTRTLAVDYASRGIRVNAIVPGPTETPLMWMAVPEDERPHMRATIQSEVPLGRMADPDEPARAAVWLLSDEASYVTGSHLVCDGGVLAKASVSV